MADIEVDLRAGARFVAGEELYRVEDGHWQFKYLPAYALWLAPFALLPIGVAKALIFYIVAAAVLVSVYLSYLLVKEPGESRPLLMVVTFLILAKFYGHELTLGKVHAIIVVCLPFRPADTITELLFDKGNGYFMKLGHGKIFIQN